LLEVLPIFLVSTLIGGIKYPIASSIFSLTHGVGNYLYQVGYADTKIDDKGARYAKGGWLKWIEKVVG
jgi:hypothetical protein